MKKMMNKILALSVCLVLILTIMLPVTAVASSITVILENDGKAVADVAFKIYYVATTENSDYILTDDFENSGVNLSGYNRNNGSDYANKLKAYAQKNNIKPVSEKVTDSNGKAVFAVLDEGVYLVVGEDFINGKVTPFIAELPSRDENGTLTYNIVAKPKSEMINPEEKSEQKTTEIKTTKYDEDNNNGEKLPQTGQLWWPVFTLTALGLLFIVFGVAARRREDVEEKE